MGKHEIYSLDGNNIDNGSILIELTDSSRNFASEIGVEYQIDKIKGSFSEYVKEIHEWYSNNMESEIDRILLSLKDGLEERLLNALKLRLKTLKGNQKFDVLAVPCNRLFIVSADKKEEFLNQKTDSETARMISEMTTKLKTNNLVDGKDIVLKKTKNSNKK